MSFYNIIDFISRFVINLSNLFNTLFFQRYEFVFGGQSYTLLPIGLLTGGVALIIGILRRII